MLQACLNGGRMPAEAPAVPISPDRLAADAAAARAAGADCLHVHPRDRAGAETLEPDEVAAALSAIRDAVPGMAVGIGTGSWIAPGGVRRHAHMRGWRVRPDYVSVNLNEADAPQVVGLMAGMGVAVEAGIWSRADAERFLAGIDPAACLRVLVEMPDAAPEEALAEADGVLSLLRDGGCTLPVLLHGLDRSAWPCLARAAALGLDTRIGFEDVVTLPDGRPAPDNAALVSAARAILDA